jgi:Zn finger protein HypA/HybF involved in hydrogenase expression
MSMSGFRPGPPYFFVCKKCEHTFIKERRFALFCPACKSFRVAEDLRVRK